MGSKRPYELSVPQVTGAVLATVTGSAAASWFGVAGTVIGAGVMSLASTIGGAVYTYYLRRTGEKLEAVRRADRDGARNSGSGEKGSGPVHENGDENATEQFHEHAHEPAESEGDRDTAEIDTSRLRATRPIHAASGTGKATGTETGGDAAQPTEVMGRRRRPRWLVIAGLAAAVFAVTMLLIVGFETLMGGSVNSVMHGRPDGGTTLFQNQSVEGPAPGDTSGPPATDEPDQGDPRTDDPDSPDREPEPADPTQPDPTHPDPTEPEPTQPPTDQPEPDDQQQPEPRTESSPHLGRLGSSVGAPRMIMQVGQVGDAQNDAGNSS